MAGTDATRRSYDAVARDYDATIGAELDGKPLDRALLLAVAELAGGGVVVDAGCGPAHIAAFLAAHGATVVGVDLSPAMAGLGRARAIPCVAGDLTALPVRSGAAAALVCLYAVIHLDPAAREAAYREFARVLRPGGTALVSFHVRDDGVRAGESRRFDEWFDHDVDLEFRYLDPPGEQRALVAAGLEFLARVDRAGMAGVEHPSERCYLLVRRPTGVPL